MIIDLLLEVIIEMLLDVYSSMILPSKYSSMNLNCSRESYNNIPVWLNDARGVADHDLVFILIGNKIDLQEERKVSYLEASRFAQENGNQTNIYLIQISCSSKQAQKRVTM